MPFYLSLYPFGRGIHQHTSLPPFKSIALGLFFQEAAVVHLTRAFCKAPVPTDTFGA